MHEQHLALALGRRCRRALHQVVGDVLERRAPVLGATDTDEDGRDRAEAEALSIKLIADANATSTRIHAEATADGLRAVGAAVTGEGGRDAMVQRLAERYVGELAEMAKASNLVIVPDKPNDISAVLTTALGVYGASSEQVAGAAAVESLVGKMNPGAGAGDGK